MSTVKANTYQDASGGNTATINSMTPTADSLQGFRNRLINSDMRIDQRNAGAAVTINSTANTYTLDRWFSSGQSTDGVFTVQRSTTVPSGFTNSLLVTVTTADASIGSTQQYLLNQAIEGFNTADLNWGTANAKTITISFWVRSSVTGTFGAALNNSANDRSYPFTYSISSANTFEYKTITIAGDTSGTWLTDNGRGITVRFSFGAGSSQVTTAGAWASGTYYGATGQTQLISTLNATWYITGVQLEVGSTATPFERRPYGTELMLCQRYCLKYLGNTVYEDANVSITGYNATTAYGAIFTVVPMRTAPSISSSTVKITDQTNNVTLTSIVTSGASFSGPYNINCAFNAASGITQYRPYQCNANNSTSAYIILSAEL